MPGNVRLQWNPIQVPDFDHYNIYRDAVLVGDSKSETFLDRDLPDGSYQYEVSAVDTHGYEGTKSAPVTKTVPDDTTPPGAPSNLQGEIDGTGIRLTWAFPADKDVASFNIYVQIDSAPFVKVGSTSSPTFFHRDLPSNHVYAYKVTALDSSGNEGPDDYVAVTILPPITPTDLSFSFSQDDITLQWTVDIHEPRFVQFEIYRKRSGEPSFVLVGTTSSFSFTDKNAPPVDVDYFVRNRHVLEEYADSATDGVTFVAPDAPAFLRYRLQADHDVELVWDEDSDSSNIYEIEVKRDAAAWTEIDETTAQSFTYKEGVPEGSTYQFRARSRDAFGLRSAYSNIVSVAPPSTEIPINLRLDLEGSGIRLVWDRPDLKDISYYVVYYKLGAASYNVVGHPTTESFIHRQILSDTENTYKVSMVNGNGEESTASTEANLDIGDVPVPVLARSAKIADGIRIDWNVGSYNPRFIAFDVYKRYTAAFIDEFNYTGTPDPALWKITLGAPTVNGSNLLLDKTAPDTIESNRSFGYGNFVVEGILADTTVTTGKLSFEILIDTDNWIQVLVLPSLYVQLRTKKDGNVTLPAGFGHNYKVSSKYEVIWTESSVKLEINGTERFNITTNVPVKSGKFLIRGPDEDAQINRIDIDSELTVLLTSTQLNTFTDKNPEAAVSTYYVENRHVLNEVAKSNEVDVTFDQPSTPQNLRYRIDDQNDVALYWDETGEDIEYIVYLNRDAGGYEEISRTTGGSFTFNEGVPDTSTYLFKVTAIDDFNIESNASNIVTVTPGTTPPTPSFDAFESSGTFNLSWQFPTATPKPAYFIIERKKDAGTYEIIQITTSQTATDKQRTIGTYTYRVFAVSATGAISASSSTIAFTIPTPTAPTLDATIEGGTIRFLITTPRTEPDPEYFLFERKIDAGSYELLDKTTDRSPTDSPFTAATYTYRVKSVNAFGIESAASGTEIVVLTTPTAPVLSAAESGTGTFLLSWTSPTTEEENARYIVERRIAAGSWLFLTETTSPALTTRPLTPDVNHDYRVKAIDAFGLVSAVSNTVTFNIPTPDTPILTQAYLDDTDIHLHWKQTPSADRDAPLTFQIVRSTDTSNYDYLASVSNRTTFVDSDLDGLDYLYKVKAINEYDFESPFSNVMGEDASTVTSITTLRSRLQTDNDVELNWDVDGRNHATYQLQLQIGAGAFNTVTFTTSQQYIYEQPSGPNNYTFRVRAVKRNGDVSVWSNTTTEAIP